MMKKFNDEKKMKASSSAEMGKGSSDWIEKTLKSKFEDVPLKMNPSFRTKAANIIGNDDAAVEIEILQKIVIRENFLNELRKLIENQNDILSCLNEVVEIVKALRFQTVDIVEGIHNWLKHRLNPVPFLYRGMNYLLKIANDLDYLDQYDDIIEKFCFEFKNNPMCYRGGGDIIRGFPQDFNQHFQRPPPSMAGYFHNDMFLDGVEMFRLRNAEKIIQDEFNRVSDMNTYVNEEQIMKENGVNSSVETISITQAININDEQKYEETNKNNKKKPRGSKFKLPFNEHK
jgi:hypothetical protein